MSLVGVLQSPPNTEKNSCPVENLEIVAIETGDQGWTPLPLHLFVWFQQGWNYSLDYSLFD